MYMTRVLLNRVPPPNIIHGVLSAAFPGERSERVNENIWRVDKAGDESALLIVSTQIPERGKIVSEIGAVKAKLSSRSSEEDICKTLKYDPFLEKVEDGQAWSFRLCANPIENKRVPGTRGKVFALRTVEEQLEWIGKQGEKHGFRVISCRVVGDNWKIFSNVKIRVVTFEGMLLVSSSEDFRIALSQGIGRGKAYGCGLLTIARAYT